MIQLTKLDGNSIIVNADEIETIESAHDSVISLKSGKKILIRDSGNEIIEKVIAYRRLCFDNFFLFYEIKRIDKEN